MDVGGIGVSGSVAFEDLRLDYGALGVGRFVLTADPSVRPQLSTTLAELQGFMDRQGLRDTFLRYDDKTGEIELGGRRPSRILFVKVNPLVTVRGKFLVDDNVISFKISSIDVRDASGMVASECERRVRALASRTVDLDEVLAGLRVDRIRLAGGRIQVEADGGGVVFAQAIGDGEPGAGD